MRILVVGGGGVGGYLAYKLIKCKKDVTLKVNSSKEDILKNGLRVKDVDEFDVVYPKIQLYGIYDVVFIATKSYHLDRVIEEIKDYVNIDTRVVPLLNGVGHFEKLNSLNTKILKGCIYILSNKEDGIIYKKTPLFYLCIEDDEKIREVFSGCDLKVKFSKDIEKDIWKKYLFIATFATLQSFYQAPTGWIMEKKRDEVEKFLDEVIKIAKDEGIDIKSEKEKVIKQALNIPYNSKMSMQIDFENGVKTEVDNITGYLAKKSEFINFYYEKLYDMITKKFKGF